MSGIISNSTKVIEYNGNELYSCNIRRNSTVTKSGKKWQLDKNTNWTIILAKGPLKNDEPDYHGYSQTNGNALASGTLELYSGMKNVFIGGGNSTSGLSPAVKAHASMMVIAWALLAPIGILQSTVVKRIIPDSPLAANGRWFKQHQLKLILAVILTLAAFITIYVDARSISLPGSKERFKMN